MRTFSSAIKDALFELNQKGIWARLYEVDIDSTTKRYLTDHVDPITYLAQLYTPFPIFPDEIPESSKPEHVSFNITVANIDRSIVTDLESRKILNNKLKITWVFLKQSDESSVELAFSETYEIIRADVDDNRGVVVFQVGQQNFFNIFIPQNHWVDSRCEFVYKDPETCGYGREEFLGDTRINLLLGLDGAKPSGWNLLNSGNIVGTGTDRLLLADIDLTNLSHLTFSSRALSSGVYNNTTANGPFLYRKITQAETKNITIEFHVNNMAASSPLEAGVLFTQNSDIPNRWFQVVSYFSGGNKRIKVVHRGSLGEVIDFDAINTHQYIKVVKENENYCVFTKAAEADPYGTDLFGGTGINEVTFSMDPIIRIGPHLDFSGAAFIAKFDFFRMTLGGFLLCDRTLGNCRLRDNTRRYGGAVGILHGPLVF